MTTTVVPFCPNPAAAQSPDISAGISEVAEETSLTTLTIPCTRSIAVMQSAVESWSASASAAAAASVFATAWASASAAASARPPYRLPPAPSAMPPVPASASASLPTRPTKTFTLAVATENLHFPNLTHVTTGAGDSSRRLSSGPSPNPSSSVGSASAPAPASGSGALRSAASRHQAPRLLSTSWWWRWWCQIGLAIGVVSGMCTATDWLEAWAGMVVLR